MVKVNFAEWGDTLMLLCLMILISGGTRRQLWFPIGFPNAAKVDADNCKAEQVVRRLLCTEPRYM